MNDIVELALAAGQFCGLRSGTPGLFALTGSIRVAPAMGDREIVLQRLAGAMLNCGSQRRDQFEIADRLDACGASLSVDSELDRISFCAQACATDLPMVVELLAECLREPRFDEEDFAGAQARLVAELQFRASEPSAMAADALSRLLHPAGHPRRQPDVATQVAIMEGLGLEDLRRYHRERIGANELRVVVVGDVDPLQAATQLDRALDDWPGTPSTSTGAEAATKPGAPSLLRIAAPGRENFEVALGHRVPIRCGDPDYLALWLANQILGAGHNSRLVQALREERGLSYSIHSELAKPSPHFDGDWQLALSLSPSLLDTGLEAARAEIARFVDGGVDPGELEARKTQAIGAFHISLATLFGVGDAILFGLERGWGPNYIREFAGNVEAVDAAQLNAAIRSRLHPGHLHAVIVGPDVERDLLGWQSQCTNAPCTLLDRD